MATEVEQRKPTPVQSGVPNDNSVTADKLAAALGALIQGTPTLSKNGNNYTIQLKDAKGSNPSTYWLARVWWSDTAGGAVTATSINTYVVNGAILRTIVAGRDFDWVSTASGVITMTSTASGSPSKWLNVEWQGAITSTQFTLGS